MSSDGSFQTLNLKHSGWLLPLAISLALTTLPSLAEGELPSRSSKESIKRGLLIKKVFPMPAVFDWKKHEVAFQESWLERNSPGSRFNLLCFKLLVDQSPTEELALQDKESVSIEFREEGAKSETALIGTSVSYPLRNLKRFGRGRSLGELIHYVEIKNPNAKKISLRLFTVDHRSNNAEQTDIVLKFDDLRADR